MKFDSIILDIDGTIWNTTEVVANAWNKAIKTDYPQVPLVSAQILQKQFGKTMKVIADNLFSVLNEEDKNKLLKKCCEFEQKELFENTKNITYPTVVETIKEISNKIPLFIVSNCQSGYIELVLDKNGIKSDIKDFECYGNNNKNKDENIKLIIERNNLQKPVYVGDTQGDYEACNKANVPFIWASYGFGEPEDKNYFAKIEQFEQIKDIIK